MGPVLGAPAGWQPDLMTFGKTIGGGLPVGAVACWRPSASRQPKRSPRTRTADGRVADPDSGTVLRDDVSMSESAGPPGGAGGAGPRAGALLARARRQRLHGRADELARLHRWVGTPELPVAFLHGPGGVGKSALLDAFAYDLQEDGRPVVRLDGADIGPTPEEFRAATDGHVGASTVVLLDRFEALADLATWLWRDWLPGLPAGVHVLVAGRHPPPAAWRADPAFTACGVVLALRNLDPASAAALIADHGITDPEDAALLAGSSRGHPLAIVVAADVHRQAGPATPLRAGNLLGHPDVTAALVERFLDDVATPRQRRALHVCGHARRVDRGLLRAALATVATGPSDGPVDDDAADDLLAWLRTRPYAESHPDGLSVHDVVKDVLDRDLRWRDRQAFVDLHAAIRQVIVDRMDRAGDHEHDRLAGDLFHLHRHNPAAASLYAFADLGGVVSRPARTDEADWLGRICAVEHRATAAVHWLIAQPGAWTVFEDGQGRRTGAGMIVRLDRAGADDLARDPVAQWAWQRLAERRPPASGEPVLLQNAVAADDPAAPGVVADQAAALSLRAWRLRGLGWTVLATALEPVWAPMWRYIGFERLGACQVPDGAGGTADIAVWARDFTRGGFGSWLAAMTAQELDELGSAPPPVAARIALARRDFDDAVVGLLKELRRPERIRANPLAESGLVGPGDDPAQALPRAVRRAVDGLRQDPSTDLAGRVLDRTYLRPAGSQERAAEVVGTSFSTYRRHLARGTRLLQDRLWEWEVRGSPDPD